MPSQAGDALDLDEVERGVAVEEALGDGCAMRLPGARRGPPSLWCRETISVADRGGHVC